MSLGKAPKLIAATCNDIISNKFRKKRGEEVFHVTREYHLNDVYKITIMIRGKGMNKNKIQWFMKITDADTSGHSEDISIVSISSYNLTEQFDTINYDADMDKDLLNHLSKIRAYFNNTVEEYIELVKTDF